MSKPSKIEIDTKEPVETFNDSFVHQVFRQKWYEICIFSTKQINQQQIQLHTKKCKRMQKVFYIATNNIASYVKLLL